MKVTGGTPGTGEFREYRFGVGHRGGKPLFTLRFTDYPGKYLISPGTPDEEKLQRALIRADVVLLAIDVPALVEQRGRYHDLVNQPLTVTAEVKRMLDEDTSRLVILAPLKCERYVDTAAGAQRVADRISEEYAPLLNYIGAGAVRSRVGCVLTPVQTIGSVVFSEVEEKTPGQPVFHFRSRRVGAVYGPVDTDQPLRYALRFIVNKYRTSQRGQLRTIWQQVMGTDAALVAAMDEFSAGQPTGQGFMVLQDHPFLQPGR